MKPRGRGNIVAFVVTSMFAASPILAASPDDAVPVDISMIQEGDKIVYQNTFAQPFYTYDRDQPGHSNCNDKCAEIWIPVYTTSHEAKDIGKWTVVSRFDGSKQWAYNGTPVYTFGYGEHAPPTAKDMQKDWHVFAPK